MTYIEQIATLPSHQQRAARALFGRVDAHKVSEAVHARVPDRIISYLADMSVRRVYAVAASVDAADQAYTPDQI